MPTSSETTAPVTTSVTTASSTTEIPTTTVVSTETTPITSTAVPTTSESTTAETTTTASSTTPTSTNNPTASTTLTSESTALSSTTPTSSETTATVTTSVTTATSTTDIPTTTVVSTEIRPITSAVVPIISESTTAETPTTASSITSTTTKNPATSTAVTSEYATLTSTTMSTSSETTAPVTTSVTTASSSTTLPSAVTSSLTSSDVPSSTTAQITMSSAAATTESLTAASTTISTNSESASSLATTTTTASTTTTILSTTKSDQTSAEGASTTTKGPSTTSESITSRATTTDSTNTPTVATTTAFRITTAPLSSITIAYTNSALSQTTLLTTTTLPPIITTVSPETITTAISTTDVTVSPTLTQTKTTEPPRTPATAITVMTGLPTTTIPADTATAPSTATATIPSSTAAQTTTTFEVTTGGLSRTTVAFTSTSSAPTTFALSTTTTSSPTMDSETTTASTTTTGIITGLTNTVEFPIVPVTSVVQNTSTSTSPVSTFPDQTSTNTTPAETLTSNTTPLNIKTEADASTTLQSASSLQTETSDIPKTLSQNVTSTATVTTKMVFSSLSSLPTEAAVLGAISTLLKSRKSQLSESLEIVNVTYQKISETSYAVILEINLSNISMPENPEQRNSSYTQVQDVVNNMLNTLLNEPDRQSIQPKSSNFTSTSNQIDGRMEYTFQDGDFIQPVSFLNELRLPTTTTVFPETTTGFSVTTPNLISGSAVVISKLVFNSSSPVPSEAQVLSAINTLRNLRESQLNESVKLVNVTYQKISETSYAVILEINLSNISMPENPEQRNSSYTQVQDVINNTLNTLLNEPGHQSLQPKSSNFTSTSSQIDGRMEYTFQDGDVIQPVSFLNQLRLPTTTTVFPETTTGFSVTTPNLISGSAVVISKLVFNSSSPVPSEAQVLSAINTLRNLRESQLNESVKLVNVTYQKISETSYAVILEINLSNISMPENPEQRNSSYTQVQDVINNTLNTLLNEPGHQSLQPKSSNFTSTSSQIDGRMEYTFQDGDVIQPVSFLNQLRLPTTTTVFPETTTGFSVTTPNLISGSAVVISKLVFNSSSPVPSEAQVLSAINTLRNLRESQLNESVKLVNVTYQKISETSYAVILEINLSNISMPENPEQRNSSYTQVQDVINNTLNTLLNEPGHQSLQPKSSNFTSTSSQIDGRMEYTFQDGDVIQPVSFLNQLRLPTTTTVFPETTTGFSVTTPNLISGSAVVISKLVFNSSSPVPSEAQVLSAINSLRNLRESQLNESVKLVNVTYQKISETSYAVILEINLSNISMPENPEQRNSSYTQVQDVINNTLNTLLNEPGHQSLQPKSSNFTSTSSQIDGRMEYTFQDGDVIQPVSFLNQLRLPTTTTVFPETTTGFSVTTPNLISGSAVVISKLVFNSSSPVPSEAQVLSAINTLRNLRESQLNESVKLVNVTYQKISETSYAVILEINLSNISMPENPEQRNSSYTQVQDVINNTLNTLLNEPGHQSLQPKSSNFTSTSSQIDGRMEYTFQDGDVIQPVSFLNQLRLPTTTTVFPETTTGFSVTTPNLISGSAVVISKLVFNSSSPVPSEALVLSAINTLRNLRESQLNESVKLVNVTYQKISETSYAVILEINLSNISMPENPEQRNSSYTQVQDVINNTLNTLLNEPGHQSLQPKSSKFTSTSSQIDGRMEYTFQDGDVIQPVSFLNQLRQPTTTTVFPETTTSFSVTTPNLISGSAVVISKLVFNSSSPVPSEALVLSAINTLRNLRESQLNESVKLVNVAYQKISETSYAVILEINLSNISMPENPEQRNSSYTQVQDVINNTLNTLLNEPGHQSLQPKSSKFTSTSSQIDGRMEYTFQDGDVIQPVSFLNQLRQPTTTTVFPETTTSFSVTTPNLISGSAVVISKLVFNSSSPVPSEALVLSAINTLRNSRESQLNESVMVVNVTYQKISETSYAVIFEIKLSNISMPENPEQRNSSYAQAQDVVNNALNTLLNEPGNPMQPKSSNFMSISNQINGRMDYIFQDEDTIQPVSFLNLLRSLTVLTTTSALTTSPPKVLGRALINIRLVFVTLGPLPNPDKVLEVANTLMNTRLTTKEDTTTTQSDTVSFISVNYTKINETAYALNFGFEISNITMTEKLELRNGTHLSVQNSINTLLGKILLSNSSAPFIKFQAADFTGNSTVIQAKVEYVFSPNDFPEPSIFVQQLQSAGGITISTPAALSTYGRTTTTSTTPQILIRRAIITIRLEFITLGPRPSESSVLEVVKSLVAANLTTTITSRAVNVNDPVTLANVVYLPINDTAYALIFAFEISEVSLTEARRHEAYEKIQNKTNDLVIQILKDPSVNLLIPAKFNESSSVIEVNVTYVFSQRDDNTLFGNLVRRLFGGFTTPVPTMNTTISNNGTNAAWVVAIIVPVAIVIGLVPCWILLCCLLCGCCAAIRRRWHRRRSYNVQYTTRNSLF